MAKRKRLFPRLAVYAVSPAELRRALDAVEALARVTNDLGVLVNELAALVGRLGGLPTPRRRRPRAGDQPDAAPSPNGGTSDA